jgi:uncharacterized OB-fold protein
VTEVSEYVLPELVRPVAQPSGLDAEFWSAVRDGRLLVQRCGACRSWQWGPEWTCYECGSFDLAWAEVPTTGDRYVGTIYSYERVWHPTHELLVPIVPYVVVLVSLPTAGDVRMIGNLTGDARAPVEIGTAVSAVFEHHPTHTLVQWERDPQPETRP